MEKAIISLHASLQKLLGLHRQLLDILRLERNALLDMNLKGIQDSTLAKESILNAIHQSELERQKRVAEISIYLKKPAETLSLGQIIIDIQSTDSENAERLRSLLTALDILIKRIKTQNLENKSLVESSLGHIQQMKNNVLGEANPKSDTYTAHGTKHAQTQTPPRLLSQEI